MLFRGCYENSRSKIAVLDLHIVAGLAQGTGHKLGQGDRAMPAAEAAKGHCTGFVGHLKTLIEEGDEPRVTADVFLDVLIPAGLLPQAVQVVRVP